MNNSQNKRKISIKTIILLMCSFIMTTFAWFTYTKVLEPVLSIHMASWNIKYFIGEEEQKNPDQGIEIPIETLYPGMEEQQVTVDIYNHGEVLVDIEHEIKEIVILGTKYELVPEGGTPTRDEYITLLEPEITTDELTGDVIYKGPILYEPEKFPFTIELEHTTQVKPVSKDTEGNKVPGQGYLKVTVNWIGDNDELDSQWGYKAGEYFKNNPEAKSAMSVVVSVESYQSADPGSITQIVLDKTTAEIRNGEEMQLLATLNAGAQENLVWESSDDSVATVTGSGTNNTTGTVTGVGKGTATIYAKNSNGDIVDSCTVTVHQYITSITLDTTSKEISNGTSFTITATPGPFGYENSITWSTSDSSVATVTESGNSVTVKGVAKGSATITATATNPLTNETLKATCTVKVHQYITGITLDKETAEITNKESITINATINEGAEDNVVWTSSDESVATVTGSGANNTTATVTGITGGTATITARNKNGDVTISCSITVVKLNTFTVFGASFTVVDGTTWSKFVADHPETFMLGSGMEGMPLPVYMLVRRPMDSRLRGRGVCV